ncbi:enolase-phosphatase E1-like [Drosophila tropicalis]|uniref:enolase-phosphatase E1-like n=1 Tax=Drosophila tropicalis TaxID=46794 RepID=UPI0035ABF782
MVVNPSQSIRKWLKKKSPEEMELLNAQLPRSSKTILKNESQVKSLSKLVSLHEDMLQDKSETSIEEEVLLPTNLHPEENEPFAKRRKFGKLENEDDESVPPQFRAASVRKHRHITETEMEIAMEDDEEDQEKIRTSNEEQMEKSQKHRRSASLTEDGQKNSMPRTSSLASPTETEKTRPRSSRASHTEDARNSSTRRKSSLASPRNTTASAVTMKRTSARDSSSKNKRDPDDDVLQSEVNLNALRNYEMAREVQDIEISRAGSAVSSQVIPKDEQSKANESSHRVSLKEYSDDNVPTEDNEQQETNKNDYRSASQIVSHYSDNDKDDDENAVPNDEDAEAASALYIRRHYTKETKSKQPGDLVTKKNIISESTSEHRVTRYPPDKPEPEIEPEPEPQPSPKPRKRRVAKKPAKSKYPSKDIVPRCVREPRCCYVGTVRAHPCRSCPHCTCTYATTRCPAYPCYEMPCCEMPRCSRFGFGGQYIYSPSHRQ